MRIHLVLTCVVRPMNVEFKESRINRIGLFLLYIIFS